MPASSDDIEHARRDAVTVKGDRQIGPIVFRPRRAPIPEYEEFGRAVRDLGRAIWRPIERLLTRVLDGLSRAARPK